MNIPILRPIEENKEISSELQFVFHQVIGHGKFILGPEVEALEHDIAQLCGVDYAVGVSSGTDALLCSLMALGIKEGDEVITSPYTFFATVEAIIRTGGTPVFVDIDKETYNMDMEKVEKTITPQTKLLLPVHLFGQCCDMGKLVHITEKYGIPVIEDACQSLGASQDLRKAGSFGLAGCFSFFPSKNLGCLGDGGMIVTRDPTFYDLCRKIRNHGSSPKYYHPLIGGNFRLDSIQAGWLRVKARYLDQWTERRIELSTTYSRELSGCVKVPKEEHENFHVYNQYMIQTWKRDELRNYLKGRGVETALYYPCPLHLQECLKGLGYKEGDFPISEELSKTSLSLPLYPQLTDEEQEYVITKIRKFFKKQD